MGDTDQQPAKRIQIGGSLETAVKGDYQINIKSVLSEAWQKTGPSKWAMSLALIGLFGIALLGSIVLGNLFVAMGYALEDPQVLSLLNLLLTVLTAPFVGGVILMGIRTALGIPCRASQLFDALRRAAPLALVALFTSVLVNLGLTLYLLPGVYLMVATSMAMPLVLEKRLTPLRAVWVSIRATSYRWFHLFVLYLVMGALLLLALIPFGLGLIWMAPMYYNLKGILYREIFGVQVDVQSDQPGAPDHTTFSA